MRRSVARLLCVYTADYLCKRADICFAVDVDGAGLGYEFGVVFTTACRSRRRRDLSVAQLAGAPPPRPHDLEVSDELLAAALTVRRQVSSEGQCADDHVRRIR